MLKPKLLIVGAFPKNNKAIYGGIAKSCKAIIDSPIFSTFDINTLDSTQISNPPPNVIIRGILAIKRIIILIYKLSFFKPNVALIFSSDGAGAIEKGIMILLCRFNNCPAIIFPRAGNLISQTTKSNLFLKLIKYLYGNTSVFLCQGEGWKKYAINNLKIDETKVKLLSNWTATNKLLAIGKNKKLNNEMPNIVFIGWLEKQKGISELLVACSKLNEKRLKFHLNIVGDGSYKKTAKNFVLSNNLENNVSFYGWANSSQVESILKKNDIFVLPSWSEGFPNSLVEAMAAGLASVVTSVGMISDYLVNNKHALIVQPKDVKGLQVAIESLILDKELREKIASNGYKIASDNFSLDMNLNQLVKVIKAEV